jgi:bleomycin hydrolase
LLVNKRNKGSRHAQTGTVGRKDPTAYQLVYFKDGKVTKWRVENSWGEESNVKGYLMMTTEW